MSNEADDLREVIREAHAATRDLRLATKEARAVGRELLAESNAQIVAHVNSGLKEFSNVMEQATQDATAQVYKRFDTITDVLLGEDKASRRKGKPSIEELARGISKGGKPGGVS